MGTGKKLDLGLPGIDSLFTTQEYRDNENLTKIRDIPINQIDEFPGHPFKVLCDDDMQQLSDSIKERGVITPATVRQKADGRYELISGHRRKKASELAGLDTLRCEVTDISDEDAIILMVESNIQRTKILPSEKAFAYKMRLEAMNKKGGRPVTGSETGSESHVRTNEQMGTEVGESREQIRRYIRLTHLDPALLDMVDQDKLKLRPAVEISYLDLKAQELVIGEIKRGSALPTFDKASRLRTLYKDGGLTAETVAFVMNDGNKKESDGKVVLKGSRIRSLIPKSIKPAETEDYICKALEYYIKNKGI